MKNVFRYILGVLAKYAAKLVWALTPAHGKTNQPMFDRILETYGYSLKPLWQHLSPLSPNELDVSIVIPCYNAEKYLSRLLDTALNQRTNYQYEVIAIDDGSIDQTLQILQDYAHRYPNMVVHHQDNTGISMARNKGIELARGEYVGFADNDDCLSLDYVETLFYKARQYDADMVQGSYVVIDAKGKEITCSTSEKILELEDEADRWQYCSGYMWRSIYRKSCFNQIRFPERFWYEDMMARLALLQMLKRVVVIPDVVYMKYDRADSASVRQQSQVADIRCLDQYWLAKSLVEYTHQQLGEPINDFQYRQLIAEWSNLFWQRMRHLDRSIRKTAFLLASAYLRRLDYACKTLTASETFQEKTLKSGHFTAWELHTISLIALKRKD